MSINHTAIKQHIVWWETGAQPPKMLADGEVVMTTAYNGRIFNARYTACSPTRRSAMPLISTHAETGVDMKPHMATSPENADRAQRNGREW